MCVEKASRCHYAIKRQDKGQEQVQRWIYDMHVKYHGYSTQKRLGLVLDTEGSSGLAPTRDKGDPSGKDLWGSCCME